ncbi:MAG: hypothetical protein KDE51_04485 [Anaerolineales bacterium]|nr:hypothetical protein [Anaerolineales bacterium]
MSTAFATLDALDDDTWFDITKMVTIVDPGSPDARDVTEERNASQATPMASVSKLIKRFTPTLTCYDTNGVAVDHGLTNDFDLRDLLDACMRGGIIIPFRYSVVNEVGANLHEFENLEVLQIQEGGIDVDQTGSLMMTVNCTADDRTATKVS